jgi:hypothetical protein
MTAAQGWRAPANEMEASLQQIEVMLERGVDDATLDEYIEAQNHLSRDAKDALWLAWAAREPAPAAHGDRWWST